MNPSEGNRDLYLLVGLVLALGIDFGFAVGWWLALR